MKNLTAVVEAAGSALSHVVKTTVFLKNMVRSPSFVVTVRQMRKLISSFSTQLGRLRKGTFSLLFDAPLTATDRAYSNRSTLSTPSTLDRLNLLVLASRYVFLSLLRPSRSDTDQSHSSTLGCPPPPWSPLRD